MNNMTTREIYHKYKTADSVSYPTFINRVYRYIAENGNDGVSQYMYGDKKILSFREDLAIEISRLVINTR